MVTHHEEKSHAAWSTLAEANFAAFFLALRHLPGVDVSDTPVCLRVRMPIPFAFFNPVFCRHLPDGDALAALVAETMADYAAHDCPSRWIVTPQTTPPDAGDALLAHGLTRRGNLPIMAMDLG